VTVTLPTEAPSVIVTTPVGGAGGPTSPVRRVIVTELPDTAALIREFDEEAE
jgi:hypothetical protein